MDDLRSKLCDFRNTSHHHSGLLDVEMYVLRFVCVHGLGQQKGRPFCQFPAFASVHRIIFRLLIWFRLIRIKVVQYKMFCKFNLQRWVDLLRLLASSLGRKSMKPSWWDQVQACKFSWWEMAAHFDKLSSSTPLSNFAISSYVAFCLQFLLFPIAP